MPRPGGALRASRLAVTAAYASQGLGYAVVVTSLPALKARQSVDDATVSLIVLGVSLTAAVGSIVANAIAVRGGSRAALAFGLLMQAALLPAIALPTPFPVFFGAFLLFGLGLGCVDAAAAMQGVAVQRSYGRHLLGGFFAAQTAAAIVGAVLVSFVAFSSLGAGIALATAGVVALLAGLVVSRFAAREVPVDEALPAGERAKLPRAGIWIFGLVILAVFISDSAISTWSTVYLQDELRTFAWVAPLGYAAYQGVVLVTRLVTDPLVTRFGRRPLVGFAAVVSAVGCVVVALLPFPAAAIAGFALAGVASGILIPVTFGAAGDLAPAHSDQIIARVNIFNYAGSIFGAVVLGLLAGGPGLGIAFLIPAVALFATLLAVPRFRAADASKRVTRGAADAR